MIKDDYDIDDVTAQEMAMHVSMCVNAEYIHSWGLKEFMTKLLEYVEKEDEVLDIIKFVCSDSPGEDVKEKNMTDVNTYALMCELRTRLHNNLDSNDPVSDLTLDELWKDCPATEEALMALMYKIDNITKRYESMLRNRYE